MNEEWTEFEDDQIDHPIIKEIEELTRIKTHIKALKKRESILTEKIMDFLYESKLKKIKNCEIQKRRRVGANPDVIASYYPELVERQTKFKKLSDITAILEVWEESLPERYEEARRKLDIMETEFLKVKL